MTEPPRSDPGASPRISGGGEATRDPALFSDHGDTWRVEVVPLPDVGSEGRKLDGGGHKPRAIFEVRAEYMGDGIPAFEPVPGGVKRVETWLTPDLELARKTAAMAGRALHGGVRNLFLPSLATAAQMP
jgi:hypothetical protein